MLLYYTYLFAILFGDATIAQETNHKFRLRNRGFGTQAREPFRLVYSKGRLVGVLEPFADVYQLASVSSEREGVVGIQPLPLKVQVEPSEESETDQKEYARYTDENYPMILTNFKIDSKINAKHGNWGPSNQGTGHSDSVKTTLDSKKKSQQSDSLKEIEGDLRGLISDLGLADSEEFQNERRAIKRDTNIEDEDLEEGPNSIQIVKATHDSKRKKRAEFSTTPATPRSTDQNLDTSNKIVSEKPAGANKSPVIDSKDVVGTESTMEDYERQFEKKIQQRIDEIKEEIKREIASAQTLDNPQQSSSSLQEVKSKETNPDGPLLSTKSNSNVRSKRDAVGEESTIGLESGKEDKNGVTRELSLVDGATATTFTSIPDPRQTLGVSMRLDGFSESAYTDSLVYESTTRKPSRKRRELNWRHVANIIHRRKKRAEALVPDGNVAYLPYRAEDEEVDEEGDEFEDDGFDDRSARYSLDPLEYEESYGTRKYAPRFLQEVRRKRHNFAALHGEGRRSRHLEAIEERGASKKRNSKPNDGNGGPQQRISDVSDIDLFGGLPQSYEGDLSRFKRVKRKIASPKGEG